MVGAPYSTLNRDGARLLRRQWTPSFCGDLKFGSGGDDGLFEASGGMGRPLQYIGLNAARQITHVSILELSGSARHWPVKPRLMLRTTSHEGTSSRSCYRHVLHGGSSRGLMSCLLLLDQRWCDSDRLAAWVECLLVSSPEVSSYQGVISRIRNDGTYGFNDDLTHSSGNTRSLIRLC